MPILSHINPCLPPPSIVRPASRAKSHVPFLLLMQHQRISPSARQLWKFRVKASFYGEELLAPLPTPKLENRPLSAAHDCVFSILGATLHIGRSIRKLRTRYALATGTSHMYVSVCTHTHTHTHTHIHSFIHTHTHTHNPPLVYASLFYPLFSLTPFVNLHQPPRNLLFLIFGTPFDWLYCMTPAAYFWWNSIVAYHFLFTPCWICFHERTRGVKQGFEKKKKKRSQLSLRATLRRLLFAK